MKSVQEHINIIENFVDEAHHIRNGSIDKEKS